MSRDYIVVGPTPDDEQCAQVGTEGYATRARRECAAYVEQLKRVYGDPPGNCKVAIKSNPHDFGTYYEVVVWFDPQDADQVHYAYEVENGCTHWDQEAKETLNVL